MKDPHCSSCFRNGTAIEPRHSCSMHRAACVRYKQKKKKQKLCINCSKPAAEGIAYCEAHARARSVQTAIRKYGKPPHHLTRWNPSTPAKVVKLVYLTNPYLHRDWNTAEPFIYEHYNLWLPHDDNTWQHRIYVDDCELQALCD